MISFKQAKKLKVAGLEWEPRFTDGGNAGDWFYWPSGDLDVVGHREYHLAGHLHRMTFAPRLDQILSEIERRGWDWELERSWVGITGVITKVDKDGYQRESSERCGFNGHSPEQAAAKALLWILRRERDAE